MIRRALVATAAAGALMVTVPGLALAQPEEPPDPPVANCDPFSSLVCQVPVTINVGPIPVEIGSIFAPPPATP